MPMTSKRLTVGCHLSTSDGYAAMGSTAVSIDATTFAFFTRNPRGGRAKDIDPDDAAAFRAFADDNRRYVHRGWHCREREAPLVDLGPRLDNVG